MWCAPTKPGPTRPMPMRVVTRLSRQRLLRVGDALLHFLDRRALAAVLVLDVDGNRPPLALDQLQRLADRRLALAPWQVVALILLSILQVQVRDVGVMRLDELDGVEVGGGEMP